MSKRLLKVLSLGFICLALLSQEALAQLADNQKILTADRAALVNPVPTTRNFSEINKAHELLIAVIDTGVDYNHPMLEKNIHFELDGNGKPIRLGWDFSGNDAWPAPMVAKSADLDSKAPKAVLDSGKFMSFGVKDFLKSYPQYSAQMNPLRHIVQELGQNLYHGTHVAGLMTYDDPRLGLLAYRSLPFNLSYNRSGEAIVIDSEDYLSVAIKKAIQDGARVINMSLGTSLTKQLKDQSEDYYNQQLIVMDEIKKIAAANPQVAFVAASGNEGAWIDDKSRLGLPCGVNSPNILCVGAIGTDGEIASFSNVVLPDYPFLLAPGENIYSLYPTQFCQVPGAFAQVFMEPAVLGEDQKNFFFKSVADYCGKAGSLYSTSGTSMASPIAARMVAKAMLTDIKMSGSQAIQKVLSEASGGTVGRLNVKRVRVEKPSWYPKTETFPMVKAFLSPLAQPKNSVEYFDFYTK